MKVRLSIRLPQELKDELDRFAAARGVWRSHVVREAIEEHLLLHTILALREALIPYAKAEGVLTDADVFLLSPPAWAAGQRAGATGAAPGSVKSSTRRRRAPRR